MTLFYPWAVSSLGSSTGIAKAGGRSARSRVPSLGDRRWRLNCPVGCASIAPFPAEVAMASKFRLCSFKTCPWVQRAAIVLQAKQVAYDITYIDRDNRPAWFLAVSPHSKVPVLQIDEKEALFESNAIAEFLDETAQPRLHPEDALQRARNRA